MGKGGGGGGSPAPSSQSVSNTSIPSYAQPYVEDMLGRTAALTDINQNPYQQYGGQRLAEFTPLQNQAFTNIANQQVAGQLGTGTNLATAGGTGSLGVAGQMMGAGQNYARMATDPSQIQAYMNPYIQQSLAPQLALLKQQQALGGQEIAAKAVGQGAFGGNRAALAQGLNAQNYDLARQQAIGQGYNQAFQQAQQAQQFGANLGLQGQQGALSGLGQAIGAANTLGQLGQTQYAQETGINQAQLNAGSMQQQQQQRGLDTAYQDFLKQQNYPYQQLAFQSDMLRGLPLSQSAQTIYTAPPSMASQLGGAGMTALGIYGMSGGFKAKGGMVGEGYAEGGQVGYSVGGKLASMSDKQLEELLANPKLSMMERDQIEEILNLHRRMKMNPQTAEIMGGGVDTIPSGDMFEAAGGGIVAFSTGGTNLKKPEETKSYYDTLRELTTKKLQSLDDNTVDPFAESKAREAEIQSQLADIRKYSPFEALAMAGLGTMAGTSQYGLTNLGLGGIQGLKSYAQSKSDADQLNKLLLQQGVEREKSKYARDMGTLNAQLAELGRMDTKEIGLLNAKNTAASTAAYRDLMAHNQAENAYRTAIQRRVDSLIRDDKNKAIYEQNPKAIEREAEKFVQRNTSARTLKLLGIEPPTEETPAPAAPKPGVVTPTPVPASPAVGNFTVTAPNGKVYTFPTKEAADKFKAQLPKN